MLRFAHQEHLFDDSIAKTKFTSELTMQAKYCQDQLQLLCNSHQMIIIIFFQVFPKNLKDEQAHQFSSNDWCQDWSDPGHNWWHSHSSAPQHGGVQLGCVNVNNRKSASHSEFSQLRQNWFSIRWKCKQERFEWKQIWGDFYSSCVYFLSPTEQSE